MPGKGAVREDRPFGLPPGAAQHAAALRQNQLKKFYQQMNEKVVDWIDFFADKKPSVADSFKPQE